VDRNDVAALEAGRFTPFPGPVEGAVSSSRPDIPRVLRPAAVKEVQQAPPQAAPSCVPGMSGSLGVKVPCAT